MLLNIALHHFAVEGERFLLSELIWKLTLLRLHMVCLRDTNDIGETVGILVLLVLGLVREESLVLPGCVNLLSETASGRLVLRWILVELTHFIVELIDLVLTDLLRDRVSLTDAARADLVASVNFFTSLELLNLPLHISDLCFESFVAEHCSAFASDLDAEVMLEAIIDG